MYEIRMAHPAKNALGTDLVAWLEAELDQAGDAPVFLTGTDGAFCAGLNLKEVAACDVPAMERMLLRLDALALRILEHPAPTVAFVNGHAIAGGCVLVQCCDYRVAIDDPKVRIGLNEVALGACYPPGILNVVRHRLPRRVQAEVLLGAGLYAPTDAMRLGLIDDARPDAEDAARAWIDRVARHPRRTYAHTKSILNRGVARANPEDSRRFLEEELPIWTSDEIRERVRAVLAR